MATGAENIIVDAANPPQSTDISSMNEAITTGAVFVLVPEKTNEKTNSCQDVTNEKNPIAKTAGFNSGNIILKRAPILEHPSIIAASSSSQGT